MDDEDYILTCASIGGVVCGIWGVIVGFAHAGIGGAIAYGLLGFFLGGIAGAFVGYVVLPAILIGGSVLIFVAIVGAIIFAIVAVIAALWNVGKP